MLSFSEWVLVWSDIGRADFGMVARDNGKEWVEAVERGEELEVGDVQPGSPVYIQILRLEFATLCPQSTKESMKKNAKINLTKESTWKSNAFKLGNVVRINKRTKINAILVYSVIAGCLVQLCVKNVRRAGQDRQSLSSGGWSGGINPSMKLK